MKNNNNSKKIIVAAIAATLAISAAPVSQALAATKRARPVVQVSNPGTLEIKYAGESDGYVFIRIALKQPVTQKSFLQIFDVSGEKLFEESVFSKDYSRIVKVSPDELKTLLVSYVTSSGESKKTFTINTSVTAKYEVSEVAE